MTLLLNIKSQAVEVPPRRRRAAGLFVVKVRKPIYRLRFRGTRPCGCYGSYDNYIIRLRARTGESLRVFAPVYLRLFAFICA